MSRLRTFRQILKWFAIHRLDPNDSKWRKIIVFAFFVASISLHLFSFYSTLSFFVTFLSSDMKISLNCLYAFVGAINIVYSLLSMFFLRHKVNDIFDELTMIFAERTMKAEKCMFSSITKLIVCFKMQVKMKCHMNFWSKPTIKAI